VPTFNLGESSAREISREVVLEGRKYRFWTDVHGALRCDRHGELWRDFIGDKAVRALFDEVVARAPSPAAGSYWDEDPEYAVADWRYEVANDDTRLGYLEWVEHQRESATHAAPSTKP